MGGSTRPCRKSPDEIFDIQKWTQGSRTYPSPAIKQSGQEPAVKMEEKQDALWNVLFQPGFTVPTQDPPNFTENLSGDIPHERLTQTEVKEDQSPSKALGDS